MPQEAAPAPQAPVAAHGPNAQASKAQKRREKEKFKKMREKEERDGGIRQVGGGGGGGGGGREPLPEALEYKVVVGVLFALYVLFVKGIGHLLMFVVAYFCIYCAVQALLPVFGGEKKEE